MNRTGRLCRATCSISLRIALHITAGIWSHRDVIPIRLTPQIVAPMKRVALSVLLTSISTLVIATVLLVGS